MATLTEEYLRKAKATFKEVMQREASKPVSDLLRFKKARDSVVECEKILISKTKETE